MKKAILILTAAATLVACNTQPNYEPYQMQWRGWNNGTNHELNNGCLGPVVEVEAEWKADSIANALGMDSVTYTLVDWWTSTPCAVDTTTTDPEAMILDLEYGNYKMTWRAIEEAGWAGGYDFDTVIRNACDIYFFNGKMMTSKNDTMQPIPFMGFLYENSFAFDVERTSNTLMIGGETWKIREKADRIKLIRITDYNGMGKHKHVMILKK